MIVCQLVTEDKLQPVESDESDRSVTSVSQDTVCTDVY